MVKVVKKNTDWKGRRSSSYKLRGHPTFDLKKGPTFYSKANSVENVSFKGGGEVSNFEKSEVV